MPNKILGIIPARYESSRFPGKPLADIGGKSMIQRVYEQSSKSTSLEKLVVATDNNEVLQHVKSFGGNVVMTSPAHPSGTDRCFDALSKEEKYYEFVINIQGDEPFIDPAQIDRLVSILSPGVELGTLVKRIDFEEELDDTNEVKVVLNRRHECIYFSRNPIPYLSGAERANWIHEFSFFKHIGIYAYRTDVLELITKLPVSSLEQAERLEQLRWIENGYTIKASITDFESMCIDVPEDIDQALKIYNLT